MGKELGTENSMGVSDFNKEALLLEPVAAYFRRKGFKWQQEELPFYEYRVDLYGVSGLNKQTIAIELKLYKWQRAFEQAILYQLCADHVYIAMPVSSIERVDTNLLENHGIGLLAVGRSGRCHQVLASKQSTVVRSNYKDVYVSMLKEGVE
jgi:hypothetical protein